MITKRAPTKDGRKYVFRIKYRDIYGKLVNYESQKYMTLRMPAR